MQYSVIPLAGLKKKNTAPTEILPLIPLLGSNTKLHFPPQKSAPYKTEEHGCAPWRVKFKASFRQ